MGLFSRNFNKPGPGVQKDEPRKKGAARFFELLTRDFGDLIKLNMMYCLCLFPSALMFILALSGFYPEITLVASLLLAFPAGGASVACYYYISKLMRDDPSYVWYDFKRKFIENYKQAAPVGILCTAFVYTQILLWGNLLLGEQIGDITWLLLALMSLLIFGMITPYMFLHLAYIELKTFRIIKNSILMSFGYLPRSFMGAITGGLIWIAFALYFPISMMLMPLVVLILISVSNMLTLMWIWPPFNNYFKIEETLIQRQKEEEGKEPKSNNPK